MGKNACRSSTLCKNRFGKTRAVDPDSLNLDTDPDLTFPVNPDMDPDTYTDLDVICIQNFDDQKLKKKIQTKKFF